MTTTTATSALSGLNLPQKNATASQTLGQDSFLKLLTTQMTTQDPFKPVDNTQMVAQMAQFSSVAGIAEMNSSLKAITEALTGSRMSDAASWIGRDALVESTMVASRPDGSFAGEIGIAEDASAVSLSLVDADGKTVHTESFTDQKAGTVAFAWNGKDAAGEAVKGPLKIVATATGANGAVATTAGAWTRITGIHSPAGGAEARLVTALGLIPPEDAVRLG